MSNLVSASYRAQELIYDVYSRNGDKAAHAVAWLWSATINHWRFDRVHKLVDPLLDQSLGHDG